MEMRKLPFYSNNFISPLGGVREDSASSILLVSFTSLFEKGKVTFLLHLS